MPTIELKSRFCPSPTGLMHLGNARTALFNALLARVTTLQGGKGVFLLRIEDTDAMRSNQHYTECLQEDLHWLGIDWQEGPYWQSERDAIYAQYYLALETSGQAYPCFCSDETLMLTRQKQLSENQPPRYSGTCRTLNAAERETKRLQGIQPNLRFRVPDHKAIEFTDGVRGFQRFQTDNIGDFIIRRADGSASFLFSNVLDDALMGVTQVLRGEDHLSNTPRQLLLLKALKLPMIQYAHMALITSRDGSKLSKRQGNRSLQEMRSEGFLPIALINYMARLGHHYEEHSNDLLSFDELAAGFSLKALSTSPAKFDPQQLLYWQKQAVAQLSEDDFFNWMGKPAQDLLPRSKDKIFAFIKFIKNNMTFPSEVLQWANILYGNTLSYTESQKELLASTGHLFFSTALSLLTQQKDLHQESVDFSLWSHAIKNKLNTKGKALFMPLRIALTGEEHGPELADLCKCLGPEGLEWISKRLEQAMISGSF